MSESTYRAAVIGLGRMGSTFDDEIRQGGQFFMPYCHAPTYVASPQTELVAGADPHAEQGAIFADRWGLEDRQIYADYRQMLETERPDFVSMCTTARLRAGIMIDAINAGVKAIWAEKPFTLSLAEADEVIELAARKGVAIAVNCSRRYNVFFTEARRMVEEGELGEILQITAYTRCTLSANGSHAIDTMRYLAGGDVEWVFGEMESDEKAAADEDLMGQRLHGVRQRCARLSARHAHRRRPVGIRSDRHGGTDPISGPRHGNAVLPLGTRRAARPQPAGARPVPAADNRPQHGPRRHRRPCAMHRYRRAAPPALTKMDERRWRLRSPCASRIVRAAAA